MEHTFMVLNKDGTVAVKLNKEYFLIDEDDEAFYFGCTPDLAKHLSESLQNMAKEAARGGTTRN